MKLIEIGVYRMREKLETLKTEQEYKKVISLKVWWISASENGHSF